MGVDFSPLLFYNTVNKIGKQKTLMISFTQNNKIAISAIAIFFVSFSAMLFLMDSGESSPDYIKSDVLQAVSVSGGHSSNHSGPYFSGSGADNGADVSESHSNIETESSSSIENMYRIIVGNLDEPLFVLYPEGKVKFLSEDFIENYGYDPNIVEEVTKQCAKDKTFFSLVQGEDLPDFVTEYTSVINSAKSKNGIGPYRFLNQDGSLSVHLVDLIPVVDNHGKVTEVIGCVKDITSKFKDFEDSFDEEEPEEISNTEELQKKSEEHFSTRLFKRLLSVKWA